MGGLVIFGAFLAIGLIERGDDPLDLRPQPRDRPEPGPRDRLQPADHLPLPRGAGRPRTGARGRCAATLRTAGTSVLFSAVTVAAALAGLMVFPQRFLFSMGIAGVMVALIAAAIALLVLPAVLALLGTRINSLAAEGVAPRAASTPTSELTSGFWYRLSQRRHAPPGARSRPSRRSLLILVALPAFGIRFTSVDASVLPDQRQRAPGLATPSTGDFPEDRSQPIFVAIDRPGRPAGPGRARRLRGRSSARLPDAAGVTPPAAAGRTPGGSTSTPTPRPRRTAPRTWWRRSATPRRPSRPTSAASPASFVDQKASLAATCPWAIAIIALTTIVALFLMTGSVILPVKAVLMNLLTLGSTLGSWCSIFQDGRLEGLLSYDSVGGPRPDPADPAGGHGVRPLHRLRGVPPVPHQGGPRRRHGHEGVASPSASSAPAAS